MRSPDEVAREFAGVDRLEKLLAGIDVGNADGLEIGALHNPILRRPAARVRYLDHMDTRGLTEKYADDSLVTTDALVEVDIVWSDGGLADAVGEQRFDHVVASHVIEHIPNVIWWLNELGGVLRPFGTIRLIVPDRRFTFDFHRRETTVAEVLAAWVSNQRCPSPAQILDFLLYVTTLDCAAAWRGETGAHPGINMSLVEEALRRAREAAERGVYHDTHCSVFTPRSFVRVMKTLCELDLLRFACTMIHTTAENELDFFVHLMKTDDAAAITGSWRWAEWAVETAEAKPLPMAKPDRRWPALRHAVSRTFGRPA